MKFRERVAGFDAPLVLSHRGRVRYAGGPPDNSEAALAVAFAAGADGAEVDVRGSACGTGRP